MIRPEEGRPVTLSEFLDEAEGSAVSPGATVSSARGNGGQRGFDNQILSPTSYLGTKKDLLGRKVLSFESYPRSLAQWSNTAGHHEAVQSFGIAPQADSPRDSR